MSTTHVPVLLQEIIEHTNIQLGDVVFDGTLGGGGYSVEFSKLVGKNGLVIATDLDADAIKRASEREYESQTHFVQAPYSDVTKIVDTYGVKIDVAVLDLGLSSDQLDISKRGFSFKDDSEPLDMSFSLDEERLTAKEIVNEWSEESLADVIFGFGGERYAKRIARKITEFRSDQEISTVGELVEIIKESVPSVYLHRKTHPATKTFQALRIAVNTEWKHLNDFLETIQSVMNPGGRIAIVSFHSGEDRVVKHLFRDWHKEGLGELITKKPIMPTTEEVQKNPRSRSAVLRIIKTI